MNMKNSVDIEHGQLEIDSNGNGNSDTHKRTTSVNDAIINSRKTFSVQTLSSKHLLAIEQKESHRGADGYILKEDGLYSLNSR